MKILAHRGLHDEPNTYENSTRAIERAFASEADGVEVDLQLLGDGQLIVYHDFKLSLSTFDTLDTILLSNLNLNEVRDNVPFRVLTLEEFIERVPESTTAVIECKIGSNNFQLFRRRLITTLHNIEIPDRVLFSSLNVNFLNELRYYSKLPLAPVVHGLDPLLLGQLDPLEKWTEIHLSKSLCNKNDLNKLNAGDEIPITAWTVNSHEDLQTLETLGIQGIMTDVSDFYT